MVLKANALEFRHETRTLFRNLTFEVGPGQALWIAGTNGSGKSTLLKILAGLWRPSFGTVTWNEYSVDSTKNSTNPQFLNDLVYLGHKIGIVPALTPYQNLQWLLSLSSLTSVSKDHCLEALRAIGLEKFQDIPCEELSHGQCQRVALARLWIQPCRYWILDEPLTGLDEAGCLLFQDRCLKHLENNGIIVGVSHRLIELKPYSQIEIHLNGKSCLDF